MTEHLGHEKHRLAGNEAGNVRNGDDPHRYRDGATADARTRIDGPRRVPRQLPEPIRCLIFDGGFVQAAVPGAR
jgi:hypothetical protein